MLVATLIYRMIAGRAAFSIQLGGHKGDMPPTRGRKPAGRDEKCAYLHTDKR